MKGNGMALLLGLGLAACDGGKDDTAGDSGAGGGGGSFSPTVGTWEAGVPTPVSDGCGIFEDEKVEGGTVTLTETGEGVFNLSDEEFSMDCTLSGQDFTCTPDVTVDDYTGKGFDVVLTTSFWYDGTFSSAVAGVVNFNIDLSCEGADCGLLAKKAGVTIPCSSVATADITFVE